ncbi:MAG: hypothetical protein RI894_1457 [Bacteroidota bacterium]|jgi:AAA15 family ATPase/GTPase
MINEIEIKNFRAFEHTRIKGFGAVNLIGGENSVGKTALLEALLLATTPSISTINDIRHFRNENDDAIEKANEYVWNYWFYKQNIQSPIQINILLKDKDNDIAIQKHLTLNCVKNSDVLINNLEEGKNTAEVSKMIFANIADAVLHIIQKNEQKEFYNFFVIPDKTDKHLGSIGKNSPKNIIFTPFLHTRFRESYEGLAKLRSYLNKNKKLTQWHDLLFKIDNSIVGSEIDALMGTALHLIRKDGESLPLGMFGDAVRTVTEIILKLLSMEEKVFFIDEIENGLHYTKQDDVWAALFTIAKERGIQIFATTHSKEMIESFARVGGLAENEGQGVYFNMYRSPRSGQIVAAPTTVDMIEYKLERGSSLRGEVAVLK